MDAVTLVYFIAGLVLLVAGAELLVRGASRLAVTAGISPLVVGLTVVAFGTSAPEVSVSVSAALQGNGGLAYANVVGSNIFNVLFILGLCAVVAPLVVQQKLVRVDVPVMIGVSLLTWLFSLDGSVSRWEGLLLIALLVGYTVASVRSSRSETVAVKQEYASEFGAKPATPRRPLRDVAFIVVGLVLLVLGSRWLVDGAVAVAAALGVSEVIVGLTVVAAGTSLPEVATSIMATIRGERDIAVGNVIGSNIFNLLGCLGLSAAVVPSGIAVPATALGFDVPVMVATAVACLPIFFTGHRIGRREGVLFFGYYAAYTGFLVLDTTRHDALPPFSSLMMQFVLPLTLVTLGIGLYRALTGDNGNKTRPA